MKKSITVGLASLLAFSLSACSGENIESSTLEESSMIESSVESSVVESSVEESSVAEVSESESAVAVDTNVTYTLDMLTEEQLEIFKTTIEGAAGLINQGFMTVEAMDVEQNYLIEAHIAGGVLPENGIELFVEWKETTGYYEQFTGQSGNSGEQSSSGEQSNSQGENTSGETEQNSNNTEGNSGGTTTKPTKPTNKPQPSEDQKTEQDNAGNEGNEFGDTGTIGDVTWENKEEMEQHLNDIAESAGAGENQGGVYLDPDVEW